MRVHTHCAPASQHLCTRLKHVSRCCLVQSAQTSITEPRGVFISHSTDDLLKDVYSGFDRSAGWTSDEDTSISRRTIPIQKIPTPTIAPTIVTVLPDHLKRTVLSNALVLVDKPKDWTPVDTVNAVKFAVKAKKAGHLGVLDPMATGLIVIALNQATELTASFKSLEKLYTGVIRLGTSTTTYDATGKTTDRLPWKHITDEEIQQAAVALRGELMLTPPMYSSYKYKGKPLYKLAERGMVVDLEPQPVHVSAFEVWREPGSADVSFTLQIEQNTFVRTLAHEFGRKLGCCSHLAELRREAVGEFRVQDAWNMDVFQNMAKKFARGYRG